MKVPKNVNLDYEVAMKLKKEKNSSALINNLLIKYYDLEKNEN